MRIVLIYPPPWKIPAPGQAPAVYGAEGPPTGFRAGDLDADFFQIPYGLLSLAAQARRAGHAVKVLNLSAFSWAQADEAVRGVGADLYGLSCWTANRRGVAMIAQAIRDHHPSAHVTVGGPHATPLAKEMLAHHRAIDTVVRGEGEATFLELVSRVEKGAPTTGIPGTAYRDRGLVRIGPDRAAIADLDSLASVNDHFTTHIVMTSRGCPWACTFCGADVAWGRGTRAQSVPYTLDALEKALARLPVKMIQIKDDTFTSNKKRVMALCQGIRERKLRFLWSCDTRADVLDDALLREMRLAGCQQLSLGVESGSPDVLARIGKKITVDAILASTELARKYGIRVRYYMMLGNRGETAETFQQTLAFLKAARPHQYLFSCLSIYPGTQDFRDAERMGLCDSEVFFRESFQELKVPFDASPEDTQMFNEWFHQNSGLRDGYRDGPEEFEAILRQLGDHHAAHLDLAAALLETNALDRAEHHARRALELGHPLPGLVLNHLACIAYAQGNFDAMMDHMSHAARVDPQHYALMKNVQATRAWFAGGRKQPLPLVARSDFQLFERTIQPTLPGPLAPDFAAFD